MLELLTVGLSLKIAGPSQPDLHQSFCKCRTFPDLAQGLRSGFGVWGLRCFGAS